MNDSIAYLVSFIETHWPMVAFTVGAFWGVLVWMKKQFIDSVYATKQDLRQTKEELEDRMAAHEQKDSERYETLTRTVNDNHDEIKDLIIKHLGDK